MSKVEAIKAGHHLGAKNGSIEMQMINNNNTKNSPNNNKIDHFLVNTTTAVQHLSTLTTSMSTSTGMLMFFSFVFLFACLDANVLSIFFSFSLFPGRYYQYI